MSDNRQDQIDQLIRQVVQLFQQGHYEGALVLATQARDLARQHLGTDHPDYAASLNNLADIYRATGNYAAAEPLFRQASDICRTALGVDHPGYAIILNNLAGLYQSTGNYAAAEPLLRQALEIRRTALGADHPDYARSLNDLAVLYQSTGNYAAAETLHRQALEIRRTALGADHPDYAASLNNLAGLYHATGNYAAAETLHRQALEIRRAALGADHPDYAASLSNLAEIYRTTGNYAAAEPLLRQALEIRRTALGANHPDYAQSLNNLAGLYQSTGNYAAAEPLFRQASDIYCAALGADHPDHARSLNNLVGLYQSTGNYAAAEPLLRQALEIRRTALGADHPDYAASLNNLAGLYQLMGNYAAAEPLFRQASDICRTALGADHPDYAASLNNLAEIYRAAGNYAAAESLLRQALEIRRTALGADHPDYAASLSGVAMLYHATGNYAAAEPLLRQALEIRRTALGADHPGYAQSLNNLAGLYVATARTSAALSLMRQAAAIDDRMIGQVFSIGSEGQRAAFLKMIQTRIEGYLSLIWRHLGEEPDAVRAALDLVLRRKAIGAEALAAQRDAVLSGKYPALEPQLREWSTLRGQIAQKTLAGPGPEGLPAHRQLLTQWDQQKERLEAELARRIPEMNLEQKLRAADRRAVALALPAGVVLIEFARFDVFNFQAVPARGESHWQPPRYLAFVLPAGEPDHVQMIDLGEAEPIDRMIRDFRAGITGEVENRPGRDLVAAPIGPARAPGSSRGPALRAAVFDKLALALAGCKRLLLAPDGDLTRLPFEVLPTASGRRLIEEYAVSYLSCGRDVLRFGAASSGQPAAPVVVADPDFDLGARTPLAPHHPTREPSGSGSPPLSSPQSRDLDRSHLRFGACPARGSKAGASPPCSEFHLGWMSRRWKVASRPAGRHASCTWPRTASSSRTNRVIRTKSGAISRQLASRAGANRAGCRARAWRIPCCVPV